MLLRCLILFVGLGAFYTAAWAQAPTERSAEEKAYRAALRHASPSQKIAALEEFLNKNPQSAYRTSVQRSLLETLIEQAPEQKEKILAQANRILALTTDATRGNWYSLIAGLLLDKGILLEEAEQFAEKSVALLGDRKNPAQASLGVSRLATLGRIALKRGKVKEAEALLQEAFAADATAVSVQIGRGELATAKGNHKAALELFAAAYLSGRGREAARQHVAAAYRKVYPDTSNPLPNALPYELEAWLDEKYKQDYPSPLKSERYQPTAARTNRVVLAEVFTGASCVPCVAADLAFEAALQRYTPKELAVLMYHVHIPDLDPLTNPASEARKEFYGAKAAPYPFLNGVFQQGLGGNRNKAADIWAKLVPALEQGLEVPSEAALRISAMQQGAVIKAKVTVDRLRSTSSDLRLHLVLAEDEVRYTGSNGIRFHPMVVRAMAGEKAAGFALTAALPVTFEHTFDLPKIEAATKAYLDDYELNGRTLPTKFDEKKHEINRNGLSLVAFIQDHKTKQILQAVSLKLPAAVESTR